MSHTFGKHVFLCITYTRRIFVFKCFVVSIPQCSKYLYLVDCM
uniref:Uncharacterized protein n=1 Tax=Anguilla anguilla TaxID=7936 RepID=A0A0E9VAL1_ANGAN